MKPQTVQAGALALARETSAAGAASAAVTALAADDDIALARLWLIGPGDLCGSCPMRRDCPDQTRCLHLTGSAGTPRRREEDWSGLGGEFRRLPLGVGKVGKVGASGTAVLLHDMSARSSWIARPEWAGREGIRSFAAQPLVAAGELLGVVAVFRRSRLDALAVQWLRVLADHAAAAVARARRAEDEEQRSAALARENAWLRAELRRAAGADAPVGDGPQWRRVLAQIDLIAPADTPLLVQGEPGTGKALVARLVHERSARADGPFVRVDPAEPGSLAAAARGSAFVGELTAVSPALRDALLHGSHDARLIAATRHDLPAALAAGRLHAELREHFGVSTITVPPLRARPDDVAPLAAHHAARAAARLGRPAPRLTSHEQRVLERYPWPGNVRELVAVVERSVIAGRWDVEPLAHATRIRGGAPDEPVLSAAAWRQRERANLEAALRQSGGRVYGRGGAAEALGVPPTTLASRLKALGVTAGARRGAGAS